MLRDATERGVVNVARYFHHENVRVGGKTMILTAIFERGWIS